MTDRGSGIAAYVASGGAVIASLTLNDWAALVGICCAIGTAAVNIYYRRKVAARIDRAYCETCPMRDG